MRPWAELWPTLLVLVIFCTALGWIVRDNQRRSRQRKPRVVVEYPEIDKQPFYNYVADQLRPEIIDAIEAAVEAAVAIPDPPPIELLPSEERYIEVKHCAHDWFYRDQMIASYSGLVRTEQWRDCSLCGQRETLRGPLRRIDMRT